jgi:hypothetical protein
MNLANCLHLVSQPFTPKGHTVKNLYVCQTDVIVQRAFPRASQVFCSAAVGGV